MKKIFFLYCNYNLLHTDLITFVFITNFVLIYKRIIDAYFIYFCPKYRIIVWTIGFKINIKNIYLL